MCKRYNMHANKVKKYVLSNYPASASHSKPVGGLTHSMCLILWGLQGIYARLLLIMKLISVYLEYILVSEYTQALNSLVKRNRLNTWNGVKKNHLFLGRSKRHHPGIGFILLENNWMRTWHFASDPFPLLPDGLKAHCFISALFSSEQDTMLDEAWRHECGGGGYYVYHFDVALSPKSTN